MSHPYFRIFTSFGISQFFLPKFWITENFLPCRRKDIPTSFFLLLSFSRTQVVIKKTSNDNVFVQKRSLREIIIIWMIILNKLWSFDKFLMKTLERENESNRKKEPQILRLRLISHWSQTYLTLINFHLQLLIFNLVLAVTFVLGCKFPWK